jgi:type IV secretion system protein VirB2
MNLQNFATTSRATTRLAFVASLTLSTLARAQSGGLDKVNQGLSWVQTAMLGASATIITIAIVWAGWQMLYEGKRFHDVARVFFAAILIGAAPGLGAMFVS